MSYISTNQENATNNRACLWKDVSAYHFFFLNEQELRPELQNVV